MRLADSVLHTHTNHSDNNDVPSTMVRIREILTGLALVMLSCRFNTLAWICSKNRGKMGEVTLWPLPRLPRNKS